MYQHLAYHSGLYMPCICSKVERAAPYAASKAAMASPPPVKGCGTKASPFRFPVDSARFTNVRDTITSLNLERVLYTSYMNEMFIIYIYCMLIHRFKLIQNNLHIWKIIYDTVYIYVYIYIYIYS